MPLKLCVGYSQKKGLPAYGSLGASCEVEVELDSTLLYEHPDSFQARVREAFDACHRAVAAELVRRTHGAESAGAGDTSARRHCAAERPATAGQLRALTAIAKRHQLVLTDILEHDFGHTELTQLSVAQASHLIEELNQLSAAETAAASGDAL